MIFEAGPLLAISTALWIGWRLLLWRRNGVEPVREFALALLFAWSLLVVRLVFFPLKIIFYAWYSGHNWVPFASIVQLLTETSPQTAFVNIAGNLVLFAPLGLLLPLLFERLRSIGALIIRAAALSVVIETIQFMTRARAIDVDDLILNVAGAAVGYAVFALMSSNGRPLSDGLMARLGADTDREPFAYGAAFGAIAAVLALPFAIATVADATLDDSEMLVDAVTDFRPTEVALRTDLDSYTLIVVADDAHQPERIQLVSYQRVLPGRYVRSIWSDPSERSGSWYDTSMTSFNPDAGPVPFFFLWGSNRVGARRVFVSGNGVARTFELPDDPVFAVGFAFDIVSLVPDLDIDDFAIRFTDVDDEDVSDLFGSPR